MKMRVNENMAGRVMTQRVPVHAPLPGEARCSREWSESAIDSILVYLPSYNLERQGLYLESLLMTSPRIGAGSFCSAPRQYCNLDPSTFLWGLLLILTGGCGPDENLFSGLL